MAIDTHAAQKTYIDVNINANNARLITGSKENTALASYLLKNQPSLYYDATRPYQATQVCMYTTGGFTDIYIATVDMVAGAFNAGNWTRITSRRKAVTQTLTAGSNTVTHNIGTASFICLADTSNGENIQLDIRAKGTTTVTINTLEQYTDAIIYFIEI